MGMIQTKVAAVLYFIDSVTENQIKQKNIYIQIEQQNTVIWKEEGCAVILKRQGNDKIDIHIHSDMFIDRTLSIDIIDERRSLISYIWLLPSERYPFRQDMAVVHGRSEREEIYAVRISDCSEWKLMDTATAGDEKIRLWGAEGIVNERIIMLSEDSKNAVVMLLGQDEDTDYSYRVREKLQDNFHKGKASVYMVNKIYTDNNGFFHLGYRNIENEKEKIQFFCNGKVLEEINLMTGKEIEIQI